MHEAEKHLNSAVKKEQDAVSVCPHRLQACVGAIAQWQLTLAYMISETRKELMQQHHEKTQKQEGKLAHKLSEAQASESTSP